VARVWNGWGPCCCCEAEEEDNNSVAEELVPVVEVHEAEVDAGTVESEDGRCATQSASWRSTIFTLGGADRPKREPLGVLRVVERAVDCASASTGTNRASNWPAR